ncbi:hypothetical protein RCL1_002974 [Eukaryota sp. TZLM3-RCL]
MDTTAKIADKVIGKRETGTHEGMTSESQMKALAYFGKHDIRYIDVDVPLLTQPHEAKCRVILSTICSGSDGHIYAGELVGVKKGFVLGHEALVEVLEVGSAVTKVKPGDRCAVSFCISCGSCDSCKRMEYSACSETNPSLSEERLFNHFTSAMFGYGLLFGDRRGLQAEQCVVPFADTNLLLIPEQVHDETAILFSDVLCTSYHAVEMTNLEPGQSIVITGLGPIGLLACRWAQLFGASTVIGVDCVQTRLDVAKNLGVTTINFKEQDVIQEVNRVLPQGADAAIEAAGFRFAQGFIHKIERALQLESDTPEILHQLIRVVRPYGAISVIADYMGTANHFLIGALFGKHQKLSGGQCPVQRIFPLVLPYVLSGQMNPGFIVTHRATLEEGPEYYKMLDKKERGVIKVLLSP